MRIILRLSLAMRALSFKHFLSVVFVLFTNVQLLGQPLVPTQRYRIRTPHVDVIFKGNMSREAQRMANTLAYLYAPIFHSLGIKNKRIALILNNKTVEKNALVQLSPYKMRFGTFPSQDYNFIGSNDWLSVLATHEFRHAAQYATLQRNFNRLAYILGGELFLSGLITINVPKWLLEGDAVDRETELTASGRGRIPYFFLQYKTNLLTHKKCSYDKQQWGSFKHPVSDHYRIGYLLVAHLRKKYGDTILTEIFKANTLLMPLPMAIKKITGRSIDQIYNDMNQVLQAHWREQLEGLKLTKTTRLNPRSHADYIDYTYPQLDKKGHVIVLMSGIGTVTQFVGLDSQQRVREIFTPGDIDTKVSFSIAQNKIVWIEEIPDPRWEDRSYGVIQSYNTQTKRLKTLTHKSRYGSAALSPDATKIIAFESDEGYNHQLVILDAENGQVLQRLPNPDNHFYLTPKWSEDGRQIVVIKNVRQSVTIARIDVATGETQDLLPYATAHLGCPVIKGQYVLYNSAYSGIDNIYAIDLATRQQYQVTSSQYGAYHPSISADGQWLLFNNFTEDGMDAVKILFTPQKWTSLAQVEKRSAHAYAPAPSVAQETNKDLLAHIPNHTYLVEHYRPWQHALNVHSWLDFSHISLNTNDSQQFSKRLQQVGLDVISSTDVLNTTELKINYLHDFQEKWGKASVTINYKDWYPIISLTGAMQGNYQEKLTYTRLLALQLKTPWTLKHGQYTYKPSLATTSILHNTANITWYTQTYEGSFSRHAKKSLRDICSPWAQKYTVQYEHTPYGGNKPSLKSSTKLNTSLYFPGLAKHHAFRLCLEYTYATEELNEAAIKKQLQMKPPDNYEYTKQQCKESISASVRYALPICYPDWSISHFLYVKRLRAETGYCFECDSRTKNTDRVYGPLPPSSDGEYRLLKRLKGIEESVQYKNTITLAIVADLHLFTLLNLPQLSLGVQYSYCMGQSAGKLDAILGMDIRF